MFLRTITVISLVLIASTPMSLETSIEAVLHHHADQPTRTKGRGYLLVFRQQQVYLKNLFEFSSRWTTFFRYSFFWKKQSVVSDKKNWCRLKQANRGNQLTPQHATVPLSPVVCLHSRTALARQGESIAGLLCSSRQIGASNSRCCATILQQTTSSSSLFLLRLCLFRTGGVEFSLHGCRRLIKWPW